MNEDWEDYYRDSAEYMRFLDRENEAHQRYQEASQKPKLIIGMVPEVSQPILSESGREIGSWVVHA